MTKIKVKNGTRHCHRYISSKGGKCITYTTSTVYDKPLQQHTSDSPGDQPQTGYLRDGYCDTPKEDKGNHSVAAIVTDEFLDFTASQGNDLRKQTPGLKSGNKWCICANRWKEAFDASGGNSEDGRVPK